MSAGCISCRHFFFDRRYPMSYEIFIRWYTDITVHGRGFINHLVFYFILTLYVKKAIFVGTALPVILIITLKTLSIHKLFQKKIRDAQTPNQLTISNFFF